MIRWTGMLAVVMALGCASSVPAPADTPTTPRDLSIRIEPLTSGWVVHTNRPASVALFEIVPNRGAGLLFPDPAHQDGHLGAGSTRIVTEIGTVIRRHRSAYVPQRGGGGLVGSQNLDLFEANTPRVVVAVACECSLNLADLALPDGPAKVLGSFAAIDAQSAATRLIQAVLPSGDVTYALDRYAAVGAVTSR